MLTQATPFGEKPTRDAAYWAENISTLRVARTPTGALNLNVEGQRLVGPLQGFGQMWQKTFRIRLEGASVTPTEVIKTWKEHSGTFWPKGNRFYAPLVGIAPGEVGLINMRIPGDLPIGLPLSTGVLALLGLLSSPLGGNKVLCPLREGLRGLSLVKLEEWQ